MNYLRRIRIEWMSILLAAVFLIQNLILDDRFGFVPVVTPLPFSLFRAIGRLFRQYDYRRSFFYAGNFYRNLSFVLHSDPNAKSAKSLFNHCHSSLCCFGSDGEKQRAVQSTHECFPAKNAPLFDDPE